jgi:hypothetical protein
VFEVVRFCEKVSLSYRTTVSSTVMYKGD